MIRRILLICVVAIAAGPITTQVAAFSNAAPSRGPPHGPLKGASSPTPSSSRVNSALYAVKKGAKKASKKSDEEVVNFKKADFVSAIAEKTGMTKAESDLALAAVLNVIATVSV